ncbi:MAG TPA: MFS transporter [Acidimicrobiales bacterium]|nr:MFS transporter [Acidimicrobiales bacterium]
MPSSRTPLADSYPTKVAMVLLALCPYIIVTTAATLMEQPVIKELHTSKLALDMASGLANAGYAFGAVLAALLAKKFPPRRMLLAYQALFIAGSAVVAAAPDVAVFTTGRIAEGMATGLMLVAALPPLVTGFGVQKLPVTVAVVDIGLFGATTVGPLLGGLVGSSGPGAWRLFFWALVAVGAVGLVTEALSVEPTDPLQPDASLDVPALALAVAATVLPFFAASELSSQALISWLVLPALVIGVAALVALVVLEYRKKDAVTPVKLLAHSFPVTGIFVAMFTGAAAVSLLELAEELVVQGFHDRPLAAGLLFWPQVAGVAVAALAFGMVFRSRHTTTLIVAGVLVLGAGSVALALNGSATGNLTIYLVAAAIGFGAGATVSPGLFLAGLSVPSRQLGPAFALVELLRSEAAFLLGPVLLHVALWHGAKRPQLDHGVSVGGWVLVAVLAGGLAVCAFLWRGSGARSHSPDLQRWLEDGDEALDSPPVLAEVR